MSEAVMVALISGVLSLVGVLITIISRRASSSDVQRLDIQKLRNELGRAQRTIVQLRAEAERYRTAYLGLAELTQELLEEKNPAGRA